MSSSDCYARRGCNNQDLSMDRDENQIQDNYNGQNFSGYSHGHPGSHSSDKSTSENNSETNSTMIILHKVPFNKDIIIIIISFINVFGYMTFALLMNDIIMMKSCVGLLKFPIEVCNNLTAYPSELIQVQQEAKEWALAYGLLNTLLTIVAISQIGPWSDKYGRKIPLLVASSGSLFTNVCILINVAYIESHLTYFLLAGIPNAICGGLAVMNICSLTYVYDKFPLEFRTTLYGFLEVAYITAYLLGTFVTGQMKKHLNFVYMVSLSLALHALGTFFIILFIKDTGFTEERNLKSMIRYLFRLESIKSNIQVYSKTRANNERLKLILLTFSLAVVLVCYVAPLDILLYYCERMYSWDLTTYTNVIVIIMLITVLVIVIAIPILTKFLGVSDAVIGLVGSTSMVLQNIIYGVSFKPWIFYLGAAAGCCINFTPFALRSQISKIIQHDEAGKAFAVSSAIESLAPLFEMFSSTLIYNSTINVFPGAIFFFLACLMMVPFSIFIWIIYSKRNEMWNGQFYVQSEPPNI